MFGAIRCVSGLAGAVLRPPVLDKRPSQAKVAHGWDTPICCLRGPNGIAVHLVQIACQAHLLMHSLADTSRWREQDEFRPDKSADEEDRERHPSASSAKTLWRYVYTWFRGVSYSRTTKSMRHVWCRWSCFPARSSLPPTILKQNAQFVDTFLKSTQFHDCACTLSRQKIIRKFI